MFLILNKHLISALNKVFLSLHRLKEERKANADVVVAAKNSVSGDRSSRYFRRRIMASRGFGLFVFRVLRW